MWAHVTLKWLLFGQLWFAVKAEKHQRCGVAFVATVAAQSVMSALDATHCVAGTTHTLVQRPVLL